METVTPKVHHQRRRRSESRQRQRRSETQQQQQQQQEEAEKQHQQQEVEEVETTAQQHLQQESATTPTTTTTTVTITPLLNCEDDIEDVVALVETTTTTRSNNTTDMSRATSAATTVSTLSQSSSQQTVLLVNGEVPPRMEETTPTTTTTENNAAVTVVVIETDEVTEITLNDETQIKNEQTQAETAANSSRNSSGDAQSLRETLEQLRAPKKHSNNSSGGVVGVNTSGTAISIGQQQRSHHHHHHHHHQHHRERDRERDRQQQRTRSPRETSASGSANSSAFGAAGGGERVGILGFMEREMRQCSPTPSTARSVGAASATIGTATSNLTGTRKLPSSLSDDPQASPAQRSIRSRSSLEKSPRRKRSKSESRRRRERKLIAAGEMEVRQANETLMRYLKQCSEMNDASLSGELEIDQSFDERRVHRKTKSQRDKRGHLISKLYTAGGGLSSLLKELSDDIVPAEGEEIYNPFTPVVSPTEDNAPAHIDKMFMQTSSGYRPVERCYYKHHHHHHIINAGSGGGGGGGVGGGGIGAENGHNGVGNITDYSTTNSGGIAAFIGPNVRGSHFLGVGGGSSVSGRSRGRGSGNVSDDIHCLLETDECNSHEIRTNIQLACVVQRIWLLVANICHGLLAGLALAHLLFVLSSPHPMDWAKILLTQMNTLAAETTTNGNAATASAAHNGGIITENDNNNNTAFSTSSMISASGTISREIINDYASFAGIYLNTFYCLAIVCLVSVLDRMDICRWDLTNASEFISFRWLIIAMIYIATIILTICSDTIDEKLYYNNNINITLTERELFSNSILNVWSSLSVTRSISAICGWIMIGLTPHEDLLYEHLVDLHKYQMTNN